MVSNAFLNVITGVTALGLSSLAFTSNFLRWRIMRRANYASVAKFLKYPLFKPITTLVFLSIGIWATIEKDNNADRQHTNDINEAKAERRGSERRSKKDLIDLSATNSRELGEALAKLKYRYDSVTNEVKDLVRDSAKTRVIEALEPELDDCMIEAEVKPDSLKFEIFYCATQAAVYNATLTTYLVSRGVDGLVFNGVIAEPSNMNIKVDAPVRFKREIGGDMRKLEYMYFLTIGTYRDREKNSYKYESLKVYRVKPASYGNLTPKERLWIRDFYRKNNIAITLNPE